MPRTVRFTLCLPGVLVVLVTLTAPLPVGATESPEAVNAERKKADVQLPPVRTTDWQVVPYFTVEGQGKDPVPGSAESTEHRDLKVEPQIRISRPAGANGGWTTNLGTSFTADGATDGLTRSRDVGRNGYRFDDGLFWTQAERVSQLDYDSTGTTGKQQKETAYRLSTGQRLNAIDWGFSLQGRDSAVREHLEQSALLQRWDERAWIKLKSFDFFRPMVSMEQREVFRGTDPENLKRREADADIFSLGADGSWGQRLSWRGSWTAEEIVDPAWSPMAGRGTDGWDRSVASASLRWLPWHGAPRLDLSFTEDAGYESERRYLERSEWSVRAERQLTSMWSAQARTDLTEKSDSEGRELRRMSTGFSTIYRLAPRTQLSGEYRVTHEEKDQPQADKQFRLQMKMKW